MKVIDDFLQWEDFLKINNLMLSPKFSWFYNSFVDDEYGEDGENINSPIHFINNQMETIVNIYTY